MGSEVSRGFFLLRGRPWMPQQLQGGGGPEISLCASPSVQSCQGVGDWGVGVGDWRVGVGDWEGEQTRT